MDEEILRKLSDQIVVSNRVYSALIKEMKDNYSKDQYQLYLDKLANIMALSFDILDEMEKTYPHLNPYQYKDSEH